ncbi:MAG: DNA replication/repair protein RecF [Myxococcota bacterium]
MRVEHLEAKNFRNLEPLSLAIAPGFVVVQGNNAQGKTNLLEALYVCATGKSFRNAAPKELVRSGEEGGKLTAIFQRQSVRHQVEVTLNGSRRTVRVDGRGMRKTSQLLELVNVVAFFPDDLRIIKGSPEERRRFMDRAVANYRVELVEAASAYDKALRSRNRILKEHDNPSPTLLEVFDEQLIQYGEVIQRCRREVMNEIADLTRSIFEELMGVSFAVDLDSGIPELDDGRFSDSFREALSKNFSRDRARRSTSVGPHRADLLVHVDGFDARSFASQGQQRASVLALKLAEVKTLAKMLDSPPILLLDDVSSELDTARTEALFSAVEQTGSQVWVSTTGSAPLPLPEDSQRLFMSAGALTTN